MNDPLVQSWNMGGPMPKVIILDPQDERLLREVLENPHWAPWQHQRMEIILGIAHGERVVRLMERLKVGRSTVQRACRTFERDGIAGLMVQKLRPGRPRKE